MQQEFTYRDAIDAVIRAVISRHAALYDFDQAFQQSLAALHKAQRQLEDAQQKLNKQKGQAAKPKQTRGRGRGRGKGSKTADVSNEDALQAAEEALETARQEVEEQLKQRREIDRKYSLELVNKLRAMANEEDRLFTITAIDERKSATASSNSSESDVAIDASNLDTLIEAIRQERAEPGPEEDEITLQCEQWD